MSIFDKKYKYKINVYRENLGAVTALKFFPNSFQFLLLSMDGMVRHYELIDDNLLFYGGFQIEDAVPIINGDIALVGVAFDPGFSSNNFVYFSYGSGDNKFDVVIKVTWSKNYEAILKSAEDVIRVDRLNPIYAFHGTSSIIFDQEGNLITAFGDAVHPELVQDMNSLLGKLIRIKPNSGGGYSIPTSNPLFGNSKVRQEIIGYGLRNPWRLVSSPEGMLIADVGSDIFEELNLYSDGLINFGYPLCEGPCDTIGVHPPLLSISRLSDIELAVRTKKSWSNLTNISILDEAIKYIDEDEGSRESNLLAAIFAGCFYSPNSNNPYFGSLDNLLIYGDVIQAFVRGIKISNGKIISNQHLFHGKGITSMDIDPEGYLWGTQVYDGKLFRVEIETESREF